MIVLVRASTFDEYVDVPTEFAVVNIDRSHAQRYLKLMEEAKQIHDEYGSLYAISLFDYLPDWYGGYDDSEGLDDFIISGETYTEDPELVRIATNAEPVRQDATTIRVSRNDIIWHSYIKHTNTPMETWNLPKELLERIAEEAP